MHINRVQSPSFGRLMIDPKAEEKLNKQPYHTILQLQQAKKDLEDTKFYHIYVDENLKVKMAGKPDAYWGSFSSRYFDTIYTSTQIDSNVQLIKENSRHSLFDQYGIFKKGKSKNGYNLYRINGYNKLEEKAEELDKISEDLGILTKITLDFDKAAKMSSKGAQNKTEKQIQDKIEHNRKDLMKNCSTEKK